MKRNFYLECVLNQKPPVDEVAVIDTKTYEYVSKILKLYYSDHFTEVEDKYRSILKIVGEDEVTKLARTIKQCLKNMTREDFDIDNDLAQRELDRDICYLNSLKGRYENENINSDLYG